MSLPSQVLTSERAYVDGKLTKPAFISIGILTFITFLGNFTQLQLSAALPTIVKEFSINVTVGQWITSIFQLVLGVMVPLAAFLTRRFSTRQIVVTSMLVFTFGSILSWLGTTFPIVLLGRILEAAGSGIMWPVLQITIFYIFPLSRRGMAMGTIGVALSVSPAIGPTIGGWQTDSHGWRSIFLSLAVLGAVAALLSFWKLNNFNKTDKEAKADFFSVGLSVIGFGGLMYGFTNIEAYSFINPIVWLPMLIGIVGIVWFIVRQVFEARKFHKAKNEVLALKELSDEEQKKDEVQARITQLSRTQPPLLDLGVLKNRSFTIGTICASLSYFAFSSIIVILPLYIQNDRGYDALMSGLIMLPGAIGECFSQFFAGKLLDRIGVRPVVLIGSSTLIFGTIMMSMISDNTWIWWLSIWQCVRLVGVGFVIMPVTTWALNCLEPQDVSAGSAVTNTIRTIAGAIGAPVLVVLLAFITTLRKAALGSSAHAAISANIFAVESVLRISTMLIVIQLLIIIFFVKGEGAGSAHDITHKALARMQQRRMAQKAAHSAQSRNKSHTHASMEKMHFIADHSKKTMSKK